MESEATALETTRLRLEPLREKHAEEMVDVLAHDSLYEFTGGAAPTLVELQQRYRSQVAGPSSSEEVWCNWILRDVESARAVGVVQATVADHGAEVAWLVGLEFQGHGFGTEAAIAMCDWLGPTGVRRLTAHIHPEHLASHHIATAIGLVRSGEVDDDGEEIWVST